MTYKQSLEALSAALPVNAVMLFSSRTLNETRGSGTNMRPVAGLSVDILRQDTEDPADSF